MRRIRREQLDMTQKQLASMMGLTSKTISNRENAQDTPIPLVQELALLYLVMQCNAGTL